MPIHSDGLTIEEGRGASAVDRFPGIKHVASPGVAGGRRADKH